MKNQVVKIGDREYDLSEIADVAQLQAELVPDNWTGSKADCVRLYLATAEHLAFQLKRHLAANWQKVCKTAQEEKDEGNAARIRIGFGFELDQSAPTVVAITKLKMGFATKHSTESKPITKDITQGEFFEEDMSVILNPKSLEEEMRTTAEPEGDAGGEGGGEPGEGAAPGEGAEGGERPPADAAGHSAEGAAPGDEPQTPAEPGDGAQADAPEGEAQTGGEPAAEPAKKKRTRKAK